MGPYGSVGAHIKTGERYMAQEHFKTLLHPKKDYHNLRKLPKQKLPDPAPKILVLEPTIPDLGPKVMVLGP